MTCAFRSLSWILGLVLCAPVLAQPGGPGRPGGRPGGLAAEIPPVLKRAMLQSGRGTYSGERVIEFRRGSERHRHVEYILKDGPRSRVEFGEDPQLAGQIIVEDGDSRLHFFPGRNEILQLEARRDEANMRLMRLLKRGPGGVKIEVLPGENVAGQPTDLITIKDPKGNLFQKLWIDKSTSVILKRELFDPVGGRAGFTEFLKINYRPKITPDDFKIQRRGARIVTVNVQLERLVKEYDLLPIRISPSEGYRLVGVQTIGEGGERVLAQTYRNDNANLSLFQTRGSLSEEKLKRFAGRENSVYVWQMQGRSFALFGTLSSAELRRLAKRLGDMN